MNPKGRSAKVGDVFEVVAPGGLGYIQYTHEHPELFSLIRILPGMFAKRPAVIELLVEGPSRLVMSYPVRLAARRPDLLEWVGQHRVPKDAQQLPLFRRPGRVKGSRTSTWEVWDGDRVLRDVPEPLPPDVALMPESSVYNHAALVHVFSSDWSWPVAHEEYVAEEIANERAATAKRESEPTKSVGQAHDPSIPNA